MIIFYGWGDDTPLRRCADLAADLGIDHRFVDQHDLRQHELRVETGMLRMRGELIPLDTVSAVYARPLELPRGCDGPRETAFHETFVEWLDYSDARVVNRPEAMHSTTSLWIQASPRDLFALVSDLDRWEQNLPHYRYVKILRRTHETTHAAMSARRGTLIWWKRHL